MARKEKTMFKEFYSKLVLEGILYSFLKALVISAFVEAVVAFVFWLTPIDGTWISLGIFAGLVVALTAALYFIKYRPTSKRIAARLDGLGLEERIITMNEFENDNSYIAIRQREDAQAALKKLSTKALKPIVSTLTVVLLSVSIVLAGGMTTVNALSAQGVIQGGNEILENFKPEIEKYYYLKYVCMNYSTGETDEDGGIVGGLIEGATEQIVAVGENGEGVFAVAEEEWVFCGWSDGEADPYREEESVIIDKDLLDVIETIADSADEIVNGEDDEPLVFYDEARGWEVSFDSEGFATITVYAVFIPIEDLESDGEPGEDGEASDSPDQNEDNPDAGKETPSPNPPSDEEKEDSEATTGDQDQDYETEEDDGNNNVIDNDTNYREVLDKYIDMANEYTQSGKEVPDWLKDLIDQYYDILE